MNELRKRLEEVNQCIIIGYSMRDKHILDIFIEALRRNDKLKLILVNPDPFDILKNMKHEAIFRSIIPLAFKTEEILGGNRLLRKSSFIKRISARPFFEAMKNPLKAAQEYFKALDYKNAMKLIKTNQLRQDYQYISVRMGDFRNILGGLFYARVVSRFNNNKELENDVNRIMIEFLRKTAASLEWDSDTRILLEQSKEAIDWLVDNLKGDTSELVSEFTRPKIGVLKSALSEFEKYTGRDTEMMKMFISRTVIILVKWSTETIPLDQYANSWLFETTTP